ncbi:hypothetical protein QBC46DRAFT_344772 [Diplogelasinospora grovesii]|uniref:C2H2-type domain-containing protein n=1 Tax=Diplogelasinospora grovesii TaxID=303347 RepID=A0AAN6N135_9PEZI|nr:hypothetical protein QBC46DRAFT_344772 [Diplogelasinospora grovesii]
MSQALDPGDVAAPRHACDQCPRLFHRLCDLNKHRKVHDRPFKCSVPGCKYAKQGWPTAKELDRHVNDKHSANPRTFACLFPPCSYRSKRESNCKQHMENLHQWTYHRSKSNGKRRAHQQPVSDIPGVELNSEPYPTPSSPKTSPAGPVFGQDHPLFADSNDDPSIGISGLDIESHGNFYPDPEAAQNQAGSYVPWASPVSRIRRNEGVIENFTQTYHGGFDQGNGIPDAAINPGLPDYTNSGVPGFQSSDGLVKLEAPAVIMGRLPSKKRKNGERDVSDEASTGIMSLACLMNPSGNSPTQVRLTPSKSGPASAATPSPSTGRPVPTPAETPFPGDSDDEEDEDSPPPGKKRKTTTAGDFTDSELPCIFHYKYPQTYNKDHKDKYESCQTPRPHISILVRHLSRVPHRLQVGHRFISSFDVIDEEEHRHPKVGLCRFCWKSFSNRQDFEDHLSRKCETRSRGRREKWNIIFHTFVGPVAEADHDSQHKSNPGVSPLAANFDFRSPSVTDPSPKLLDSKPVAPTGAAAERGYVPMTEHLRLQKEHRELREKHRQLLENMVQDPAALLSALQAAGSQFGAQGAPLPKAQAAHQSGIPIPELAEPASNQGSLVLHMNSQSTDVDYSGFIEEAEETLSRQNSGLSSMSSTTHSTVNHVPTSPPALPADGDASDDEDGTTPKAKASSGRKALASIPDSGYCTDPRRHSLACGPGQGIPGVSDNNDNTKELPTHPKNSPPQHLYAELAGDDLFPKNDASGLRTSGEEEIPFHDPFAGASSAGNSQRSQLQSHPLPYDQVDSLPDADFIGDDFFNQQYFLSTPPDHSPGHSPDHSLDMNLDFEQ